VQEVMRGWLISSSPQRAGGDSTPWYAFILEFCARYCNDRFGEGGICRRSIAFASRERQ